MKRRKHPKRRSARFTVGGFVCEHTSTAEGSGPFSCVSVSAIEHFASTNWAELLNHLRFGV